MTEEQKAQKKITNAKWYKANKEKCQQRMKEWNEANPSYINPARIENPDYDTEWYHKHDLGYCAVYIITNYNGLGNDYAGQTINIYKRMNHHKCIGKLNTETYEVLEKFDNVDEALGFELTLHLNGYH